MFDRTFDVGSRAHDSEQPQALVLVVDDDQDAAQALMEAIAATDVRVVLARRRSRRVRGAGSRRTWRSSFLTIACPT